ncbi:MAG: dTDP-4-dehydrorhamnose 3,5-epimerase family protein, partial [Treponema sp.]|nr:dTDP-4-dehydrorhamnose 3,5-epimerase family protein [Treponema sp.]
MIVFEKTPFEDVKLFRFDGLKDNRGSKIRFYSADEYAAMGIDFIPREEMLYEIPEKLTLFGIHFQGEPKAQQKMIRLAAGSGIDYAVDLRPQSPTYKKWFSTELSASNNLVNTYIYILNSRTTLEDVIAKGSLPYTYEDLSEMITAKAVQNTAAFDVTVRSSNPVEAE